MGEVYRAHDANLRRDVAIKVLPASVAADPDRVARFEREARAVAALTHPNILAIHDFGSRDGVSYAVTELLEGETLRNLLERGPLATAKAVSVDPLLAGMREEPRFLASLTRMDRILADMRRRVDLTAVAQLVPSGQ
jgi:serine/threonine protein kinase